jgi:hypothetical protein
MDGVRLSKSGVLQVLRKKSWGALLLLPLLWVAFSYAKDPLPTFPDRIPLYQPRFRPFDGGEKALYRGSWNGIPVGTAEVRTSPLQIGEKKYYQVRVNARTSKVLDLFWKMRDTVVSVFEAETLQPHHYFFKQRENRRKVDTKALFDRKSNKWLIHRQKGRKVKNYEFESANTLDPITAVYLARSIDFKVGDTLYFNVFGGKSRYLLTLDVVGKERIELDSGIFEAFRINPRVKNVTKSGYAERFREASVWISADQNRIPLMMASKVFIGSVYLELIKGDHPKS